MDYEPNFMDLLTASTDSDARAKAQMIAQQLRGDKTLGMMGQIGGKRAAGLGREMLADADQAEKGLLTAGVNRLHYGEQAQDLKKQKMMSDLEKALAVQDARNKGAYDVAQLRALAAGNKAAKPLPGKEADTLAELDSTVKSIANVRDRFQAKYAGQGPLGRAANWVGGALGSWGPKSAQEQNDFWANFKMLVELPTRHKFFGSALTPTEAASWKEAQNITPGSDPELVQRKFEEMLSIAQGKLNARATSRVKEGVYSPEAIQAVAPHADTSGRTVVRRGRDKATGKRVVQYSDGSVEAE